MMLQEINEMLMKKSGPGQTAAAITPSPDRNSRQ